MEKKPSLSIAMAVQRKNKKKANKDSPKPERSPIAEGEDRLTGSKNARMYDKQREQKGVNTPRMPYPRDKSSYGESDAGYSVRGGLTEQAKRQHEETLEELRSMPDPDLYAEGGEVDKHYDSIADAIMAKRKHRKMMAEGGEVDLEANSEESPNFEDQQSFEANGKEQYDLDQLEAQPEDSNMHSVMLDSDEHDMISRIRSKMKAKRGE